MNNVDTGDLAYVVGCPEHTGFNGRVVRVGPVYRGEPFFSLDGCDLRVFPRDGELLWMCHLLSGVTYRLTDRLAGTVHRFDQAPIADRELRRLSRSDVRANQGLRNFKLQK